VSEETQDNRHARVAPMKTASMTGSVRGLLSVEEAADYLGISAGTLRNWISMRRIEYVKVGRLTRFRLSALDRFIVAHTVTMVDE
jgi:excisionase family DNA binding protein